MSCFDNKIILRDAIIKKFNLLSINHGNDTSTQIRQQMMNNMMMNPQMMQNMMNNQQFMQQLNP